MGVESALCEAGDAGEDFVRGLGPDEGEGLGYELWASINSRIALSSSGTLR
jgi:hypothetical protein